jgi:hypothetical protein
LKSNVDKSKSEIYPFIHLVSFTTKIVMELNSKGITFGSHTALVWHGKQTIQCQNI